MFTQVIILQKGRELGATMKCVNTT